MKRVLKDLTVQQFLGNYSLSMLPAINSQFQENAPKAQIQLINGSILGMFLSVTAREKPQGKKNSEN